MSHRIRCVKRIIWGAKYSAFAFQPRLKRRVVYFPLRGWAEVVFTSADRGQALGGGAWLVFRHLTLRRLRLHNVRSYSRINCHVNTPITTWEPQLRNARSTNSSIRPTSMSLHVFTACKIRGVPLDMRRAKVLAWPFYYFPREMESFIFSPHG